MGNENYDDILEMVITEMTERGIQKQREESPEIESLIQEKTALSIHVQNYLNALDSDVKKTLTQYYELSEAITDQQIKHLYLQGAKDCIFLLKSLGVI